MHNREERFYFWMRVTQELVTPERRSAHMTVLIGRENSGKTTMVDHWQELLKMRGTALPRIFSCVALAIESPKQFSQRLWYELGGEPSRSTAGELMDSVGAKLRASTDLLILDQAENIRLLTAQYLRSYVFDKWGVSLFFVGRPALAKLLHRDASIWDRIGSLQRIEQFDVAP